MSGADASDPSNSVPSGLEPSDSAARVTRAKGRPFVAKPLPPDELLAEVRRAVEIDGLPLRAAAERLGRSARWLANFATKAGWSLPFRQRRLEKAKAKAPGKSNRGNRAKSGALSFERAARSVWRAIAVLTDELDALLASGVDADEIAKRSGVINKLVADARRNGLRKGDAQLTGDAHEYAGPAAADTALDMARLRTHLVAAIVEALATHPGPESAGEPGRRQHPDVQ